MDPKGSSSNRLSAADWTLKSILSLGKPLKRVHRVSASLPKDELLAIIQKFEYQGLPLVIEGWHQYPSWSANVLNPGWLANKYTEPLPVCNVYSMEDKRMPIAELLSKYSAGKEYARPEDSERWYGKHLPFPPEWDEQLRILPSEVLPLGVGDTFPYTDRKGRPETVCYLGVGDTYTPAHKDSSASTGQNLMVYTSPMPPQESSSKGAKLGDILDSGKTSSFWFLTSSGDSDAASEWFRRSLHQDLDLGSHTITLDEFKTANFPIYVCQQKLGDMVIIPRMSCHQVVNHGGISLKVAWSRMSIFSLEAALLYELPVYHRIGRPEIYRMKRLLHETIEQLTPRYRQLPKAERPCFRRLVQLMSEIHIEEYHPDYEDFLVETTNNLYFTCDCCSAGIFQTYFECKQCTPRGYYGRSYTMCTMCYVEGRSCKCAGMAPRVLWSWPELLQIRNDAASVLRMPELTLEDYNTSTHLAIFKAAVLHWKERIFYKLADECTPSRKSQVPHVVSIVALVSCDLCPRPICYQHTLKSSFLHAAEAILTIHKDPSHKSYHSLHSQSRTRWRDAHEPGDEMNNDIKIRLARAALRYPVCRPAEAGYTRLGWYDDVNAVANDGHGFSSDESSSDESSSDGSSSSNESLTPLTKEKSPVPKTLRGEMSIDLPQNDLIPSKPISTLKRVRSFDPATPVHGGKAPKTCNTSSQENIQAQLPISTPRASSPIPPPPVPTSTSPTRRMASSPILVGPPTPVAKNPTTEESDRGDDWHAPDRGDHDPDRTIEPSSHSLPKSMDANQPQDSSLSETILKLVADHQSQLRANNEQWAARMDDQKAEDQERERRWEARLVAQREEYQTRELNQREEYRVRELAVREEYRTQEHRMEGMLTALREENKEKERLTEEHHTAMLAFYHEKETRLDQEIAMLRERERWLEGQLKDRWNPPAAYLAAPPRDNHLPAQNHDDRDTSQKNVVDPTSSADNGLGLTAVLPPTDSSPTHPDEGDFGVSLPPQLARTPGMHGAVPF